MSSINLIGNLLDPNGLFSVGDKVKFTHQTTTGETIKSAVSIIIIPPDGSYNLNLQYGLIKVEYRDVLTGVYKTVGVVTVNGDSVATTLPQLLSAITPPTPPPGAVTEAPVNGNIYGRMDAGWIKIISGSSGVEEAPIDGNRWCRSDESWVVPKMEDASDAELNAGVGFTWNKGAYTNTGEFATASSSYGRFSTTDANGVQVDISALEGLEAKVFRDNLPVLDVVLVTGGGSYSNSIGWDAGGVAADGLNPIQDYIRIVPTLSPPLPLQDGDAWIYNESEQKFKPTPAVPTVVVTEFPASPDANTLYIKVV